MVEISFRATSQELRKWAKPMLCRPGMMKTGLYYYRKKKNGLYWKLFRTRTPEMGQPMVCRPGIVRTVLYWKLFRTSLQNFSPSIVGEPTKNWAVLRAVFLCVYFLNTTRTLQPSLSFFERNYSPVYHRENASSTKNNKKIGPKHAKLVFANFEVRVDASTSHTHTWIGYH